MARASIVRGPFFNDRGGVSGISVSAELDFGALSATTAVDLTIAVPGAALGEPVILGIPHASVTATGTFSAWVSAADVVTVRAVAATGTDNPAAGVFTVLVLKAY